LQKSFTEHKSCSSSLIWTCRMQYFFKVSLQASIYLLTTGCFEINSLTMSFRLWYASNNDMELLKYWIWTTVIFVMVKRSLSNVKRVCLSVVKAALNVTKIRVTF
jgi:hypothetical protein